MSRFNQDPSDDYVRVIEVIQELALKEGWAAAHDAVAEALGPRMKQVFGEAQGVKETEEAVCANRLVSLPCDHRSGDCQIPASDHAEGWDQNGDARFFVSHPYDLSSDAVRRILKYCDSKGLEFSVDGRSWHFLGATVRVVVWNPAGQDSAPFFSWDIAPPD